MPFRSEAQRRFMWARHPEIAHRWARETPKGSLPERLGEYNEASGIIVFGTIAVLAGGLYLLMARAKAQTFDIDNPGVQRWLADNPPPKDWSYSDEEWARLEMPVWHIEGLDRLRGSPAVHAARTRARIAKAVTMAQKSLQHSACIPRKRTLIRAMRELARADENAEWAEEPEQLDMAFDAVMLAAREWQSDCG